MYSYRSFIRDTFESFKCMRRHDLLLCIPIYDDKGLLAGYLRPVTRDYRQSLPGCAEQLAAWRNENPSLSAEPFAATAESTERWLDEIIGREDRLLFYILLPDGRRAGHIGYSSFEYEAGRCEVDAVLRGDGDTPPGIMTFALNALIRWGLGSLRLKNIELRVFSDNAHAIRYYSRNFFVVAEENLPVSPTSPKRYTRMRLDCGAWRERERTRAAEAAGRAPV